MIKIIKERERKVYTEYRREFAYLQDRSSGYSFPCEADGKFSQKEDKSGWRKNYQYCLDHPELYEDLGIQRYSWNYTEPAIGRCSCGEEIPLDGDVQCTCGQWYNGFGQMLTNPEFWSDEY